MAEGQVKQRIASVLRVLELRFPPGAPADLTALIRGSTDLGQLSRWFDAAALAPSLDDFRRACTLNEATHSTVVRELP